MRQPRLWDLLLVVVAITVAGMAVATRSRGATDRARPLAAPADPAAPVRHRVTVAPARLRAADEAHRGPVRVLVVGDSTATDLGHALERWAHARPDTIQVVTAGAAGCGLLSGGTRVWSDAEYRVPERCATYLETDVPALVRHLTPDIVLVMSSWDSLDRRWDGPTLTPDDGEYQLRLRVALAALLDRSLRAGAGHVSLVLEPTTDPYWSLLDSPSEDPVRHQALHQAMVDAARQDPERVALVDLAGWLAGAGGNRDRAFRPDGVHWAPTASDLLVGSYVGPLLLEQAA